VLEMLFDERLPFHKYLRYSSRQRL